MNLTLHIPDDLAASMANAGGDLPRRALEAFGLEEYKNKHISKAELRRMLGLSRFAIDGFLKDHRVWADYTIEDYRRDIEDLRNILKK